jgi:hypothetical protein
MGPAPNTATVSPACIPERATACTATASGSASAAVRASTPAGTGWRTSGGSATNGAIAPGVSMP